MLPNALRERLDLSYLETILEKSNKSILPFHEKRSPLYSESKVSHMEEATLGQHLALGHHDEHVVNIQGMLVEFERQLWGRKGIVSIRLSGNHIHSRCLFRSHP